LPWAIQSSERLSDAFGRPLSADATKTSSTETRVTISRSTGETLMIIAPCATGWAYPLSAKIIVQKKMLKPKIQEHRGM
jgi:hypothetical protein